ncbi:MAG: ATP-binding protein, partial [Alteromonas sp.]|nr:ATP-binding protein [Alteromonas sp.]
MNKQLSEQLSNLRLNHVASALEVQNAQPQHYQDLSFNERLSLLLDEELTGREQRKIERLVKQAKFRIQAHPEQIEYRAGRGIEKAKIRSLLEGHWLTHK